MRHSRIALLLVIAAATTAAAAPKITNIVPLNLHAGINVVPGFLPDGGTAKIAQGWRGNGNAHGYNVWMVLTGPSEGWPVGIAPFDELGDTIRDDPFDGERVLGRVRFARAMVDGQMTSLAVSARLDDDAGKPLADREKASVTVYRLIRNNEGIGAPMLFVRIVLLHSEKRYCNADLALRDLLGVRLPDDYGGPNRIDGCFPN